MRFGGKKTFELGTWCSQNWQTRLIMQVAISHVVIVKQDMLSCMPVYLCMQLDMFLALSEPTNRTWMCVHNYISKCICERTLDSCICCWCFYVSACVCWYYICQFAFEGCLMGGFIFLFFVTNFFFGSGGVKCFEPSFGWDIILQKLTNY